MEHSDRAKYVTELVSTWICNDNDYIRSARRCAVNGTDNLESYVVNALLLHPRVNSAPWHLALELAPNDYNRIDWQSIADDLLQE